MISNDTREDDLGRLDRELDEFVATRDWGKYHTPDTLARALAVELVEFSLAASRADRLAEMSDVLHYLMLLNRSLGSTTRLGGSDNHSTQHLTNLEHLSLECSLELLLLEPGDNREYFAAARRVEDFLRLAEEYFDINVVDVALRKLRVSGQKYRTNRLTFDYEAHLAHLASKAHYAKSPLERAARHLEELHWQVSTPQVVERKTRLAGEIATHRAKLSAGHVASGLARYTILAKHLRTVAARLPDIAELSADTTTTANLIDMAMSASRSCFRSGRESLGLAILKEVVELDSNQLEAHFLAWRSGGAAALDELQTESLSSHARAFASRLRSGYYDNALDDLTAQPVTSHGKPRLIVVVSADLHDLDLFTKIGDTIFFLGRICDPELTIPLTQAGKDFLPSRYALLEHLVKLGKEIRSFYYRNTKVQMTSAFVFGPAIDTLFFIKVLHDFIDHHGAPPTCDRILEAGAGSGAIIYTLTESLAHYRQSTPIHVVATDISSHAIDHSQELFTDLVDKGKALLTTIQDSNSLTRTLEHYGTGSVNVLISNPPYIPRTLVEHLNADGLALTSANLDNALDRYVVSSKPRLGDPASAEDITLRATEDLDLYVQVLLQEGPELLDRQTGIMFLLTSSTSEEVVRLLLKRSPLNAIVLDRRVNVPLDVPELTSGALRAELLNVPGVTFDITDGRHPLRHTITVYALFHPDSFWDTRLRL